LRKSEPSPKKAASLKRLCQIARASGAVDAIPIEVKDVVIDERVTLKCLVPLCSFYGRNLMCPPNLLPVEEFKKIITLYKMAILINVKASSASVPAVMTDAENIAKVWSMADSALKNEGREPSVVTGYISELKTSQFLLESIITAIEAASLKEGNRFTAGFTAGSCLICEECVGPNSSEACRHPFQARPSMEAIGIDVVGTAERAGIDLAFSSGKSTFWFGLVLID
jgi:predicted metal-binding protein